MDGIGVAKDSSSWIVSQWEIKSWKLSYSFWVKSKLLLQYVGYFKLSKRLF